MAMSRSDKVYGMAPLPFQGQKRMWKREFVDIVKHNYSDKTIFVDLFGGSGLLSHFAKKANPRCRVIWNDYDDYSNRLAHIPQTNEIIRWIRDLTKDVPRSERLPEEMETQIKERLIDEQNRGFLDFYTLSRSLVFSSRSVGSLEEMLGQVFYSHVAKRDYTDAGYLDGIEVVREDYRTLLDEYKDNPNALFLLDPPYLSTDVSTYGSVEHTGLAWNIELLNSVKELRYIFFTSERSELLDLMKSITTASGVSMYDNSEIRRRSYGIGKKDIKVEDIMVISKPREKESTEASETATEAQSNVVVPAPADEVQATPPRVKKLSLWGRLRILFTGK